MRGLFARSAFRKCFTWTSGWSVAVVAGCTLLSACATVPPNAYGVHSLAIKGTEHMDEAALKVCLATQARERTGLTLGAAGDPECGMPPFDAGRLPISLWSWPWTEWPLYDEAVFDRDLSRIQRWYRARGFYAAHITSVQRQRDDADRSIDLTVELVEDEPVLVERIELKGIETLPPKLRRRVERAIVLEVNGRFDEWKYDESKHAIIDAVREASYAKATVDGRAIIDPKRRRVQLVFSVALGQRFRFGKVYIEGQTSYPTRPIWGAAEIEEGAPFSVSALDDAKRAIYELGPFASVDVEEKPNDDGTVDVLIKVVPGRRMRVAVGLGMQVGADPTLVPTDAVSDSLVQWDLHLLGKIEHHNFLGGMRRISIEDRPRLIFDKAFPATPAPELGNLLIFDFRQPAFTEARTSLVASARWDRGPDPYGAGFSRSDVLSGVGPERSFFDGKLRVSATINLNVFVPDRPKARANTPKVLPNYYPDYMATYMQYSAVVDLRDNPRDPRSGAYFGLNIQHAGYFLPSDWNYVRVTPDLRGYVPLPVGMVLAARARFGLMEITSSDIRADPNSDPFGFVQRLRDLGPLRQRLRGGGNNSVRGYAPNTLGDVFELGNRLDSGGRRQWEGSIELRAPITASFGAVLFMDVGDVSQSKSFRFRYPQTTFGFGLRYKTIIGPVRLDAGFAPPTLQTVGADGRTRVAFDDNGDPLPHFRESRLFGTNGAIHFTIGEAF
jgi:outer membrane protein assembly factor BamA